MTIWATCFFMHLLCALSATWSTNNIWWQNHKRSNTFFKCKVTLCADHKFFRVTIWSSLVNICSPWRVSTFPVPCWILFYKVRITKNFFLMMKIKESLKDTKWILKSVLFFFKDYILQQYPPRRISIFQTFLLISTKRLQPTIAITLVFDKMTSQD